MLKRQAVGLLLKLVCIENAECQSEEVDVQQYGVRRLAVASAACQSAGVAGHSAFVSALLVSCATRRGHTGDSNGGFQQGLLHLCYSSS